MESLDVSILIPVYNNPEGIVKTLDSLHSHLVNHFQEIVIIDNASTDQTPNIACSFDGDWITLLHENDVQSSYAARNTGIRNTDSDIIAFLDADMTVPKDWLEKALQAFESTNADYMGTNVELLRRPNPSLFARYDGHTGFQVNQYIQHQDFAPTCCLFVRRSVFEDVGLFDPRLTSGGDKEFGNRVHGAGYNLHYADDVTVYHPTRNTLSDLVAKDMRVGRGHCQLQRYYPDRYGHPGIPPRPSGIKYPEPSLTLKKRLTFGALSTFLTGVRGFGYYQEYVFGETKDISGPPVLNHTR